MITNYDSFRITAILPAAQITPATNSDLRSPSLSRIRGNVSRSADQRTPPRTAHLHAHTYTRDACMQRNSDAELLAADVLFATSTLRAQRMLKRTLLRRRQRATVFESAFDRALINCSRGVSANNQPMKFRDRELFIPRGHRFGDLDSREARQLSFADTRMPRATCYFGGT